MQNAIKANSRSHIKYLLYWEPLKNQLKAMQPLSSVIRATEANCSGTIVIFNITNKRFFESCMTLCVEEDLTKFIT